MAEVEELCAQVTMIKEGRVIYTGAVEELRKRAPAAVHVLQTSDLPGGRHGAGVLHPGRRRARPEQRRRGRLRDRIHAAARAGGRAAAAA